ncbi:type II toxin-antitoxin system VapC family toxin [Georgenia phoenicis]|uniref:type II toxin-antitoxin system VapC family toxin n=1 Tax=unclassified Georgenia TaxID=2626815 RepID=UPI0039AFA50E
MRLLVDTHVVLWQLTGEREVSPEAREALLSARDLLISAVSFAEIGIKVSLKKLEVPQGLEGAVQALGLRVLGLSPAHGLAVGDLPLHHRDPFDRLIIAQAVCEDLPVLTADSRFADYPITVVPA